MRKKLLGIAVLLTFILMFTACGNNKQDSEEEYITLYKQKSFSNEFVVMSEQDGDYSNIFYYDYTTNCEVYACGQPNCSHDITDYKMGKINCNAIIEGEVKYPFLYEDKLYYFVENEGRESLWQSNTDGTQKEKIIDMEFQLYDGTFVMAKGKVYVSSDIIDEIDYNEHSSSLFTVQSEVYEINLIKKSIKQITNLGKKASIICRTIQYFENKLYIKCSTSDNTYEQAGFENDNEYLEWLTSEDFTYAEDIELFGKKENYYVYDLETNKNSLLNINFESNFKPYKGIKNMDCYEIICVNGSKIFYLDPVVANYTIYSYDLNTKTRKEIISKYQISYSYKDEKIYITTVDMDKSTKNELLPSADLNIEPKYYIFDVNTNELVQQSYGKKGKFLYVVDVNEEGLLAYETTFDEKYNFIDEHNFYEILDKQVKE
jgi:hypothetical protein